MPVVRELINRISFKVNQADKKNTQDTISKIDKGIARTISKAKTLGKVLGASLIAGFGVGAKSITDFRKEISETRFFARGKEEAEAINSIFASIAEKNEFIGRSQAQRSAAIISQLNIEEGQIRKLAPLLADIDRVRDKLDLPDVAELFKQAAEGDIEALKRLLPGVKNLSEQIRKSLLGKSFADVTEKIRTEFILEISGKSEGRIKELLEGKSEDLQFQIDALQAASSDLFLGVGEKTESAMIEAIKLAKELVQTLQGSEAFWDKIRSVSDGIIDAIKFMKGFSFSEEVEKSNEKARKVREGRVEFIKSQGATVVESGLETSKEIADSVNSIFRIFSLDRLKGAIGIDTSEEPNNQNFDSLKRNFSPDKKQPAQQKTTGEQSLNINIGGTIKVENQNGVEISQVSTDLTSKIIGELKTAFNNISAQNGIVTVGV